MSRIKRHIILLIISIPLIFLSVSCSTSKPKPRFYIPSKKKYPKETFLNRKKHHIPKYKSIKKPQSKRFILVGKKKNKF